MSVVAAGISHTKRKGAWPDLLSATPRMPQRAQLLSCFWGVGVGFSMHASCPAGAGMRELYKHCASIHLSTITAIRARACSLQRVVMVVYTDLRGERWAAPPAPCPGEVLRVSRLGAHPQRHLGPTRCPELQDDCISLPSTRLLLYVLMFTQVHYMLECGPGFWFCRAYTARCMRCLCLPGRYVGHACGCVD